jgi:hypothetical protein
MGNAYEIKGGNIKMNLKYVWYDSGKEPITSTSQDGNFKFGWHKTRGISRVSEWLSDPQKGFFPHGVSYEIQNVLTFENQWHCPSGSTFVSLVFRWFWYTQVRMLSCQMYTGCLTSGSGIRGHETESKYPKVKYGKLFCKTLMKVQFIFYSMKFGFQQYT